jgi:hypothetical protein
MNHGMDAETLCTSSPVPPTVLPGCPVHRSFDTCTYFPSVHFFLVIRSIATSLRTPAASFILLAHSMNEALENEALEFGAWPSSVAPRNSSSLC